MLRACLLIVMASSLALCGCSPFYVMRAAYEQSKILAAREEITDLLTDPSTPDEERKKLQFVVDARQHGIELGLDPGETFTHYARVEGDAIAWVVSASPKDKFELYTWWFPFVGSVPYKGYFDKEDAVKEAAALAREGYETWVRGTSAFSTLGWFNDPVLSTTLRHGPVHIVNTVLHESLHTTLWVPGRVDFNESVANFVGHMGAIDFFQRAHEQCLSQPKSPEKTSTELCEGTSRRLQDAHDAWDREVHIARALSATYDELKSLYESDLSSAEKLQQREAVFELHMKPLRNRYPELSILQSVNNAEILQLTLYLAMLERFDTYFRAQNSDWPVLLSKLRDIQTALEADPSQDPFALMETVSSQATPSLQESSS